MRSGRNGYTQIKERMHRMPALTRREEREEIFRLLFETEFHGTLTPEEIYDLAVDAREIPESKYIRQVYFGVQEKKEELDAFISAHSNGWRPDRIAPVSRSILRLGIYEMKYADDVPPAVAINEAVELTKKFDEEKARSFINGVLNGVKNELEAPKKD